MIRGITANVILIGWAASASLACGADRGLVQVFTDDSAECILGLVDGDFGFLGHTGPSDGHAPRSGTEIPHDKGKVRISSGVFRDDGTLQVYVAQELRDASKTQAEKHLWYLTGDYTQKEPVLKITKEKGKYSRWEFELAGEKQAGDEAIDYYFIRNVNDLRKDAWLSMEKKGIRYRIWGEFRKATISFDEKKAFAIPGPKYGGK